MEKIDLQYLVDMIIDGGGFKGITKIEPLEQINVLAIISDDGPYSFISEDGKYEWKFKDVVMADWKKDDDQKRARAKLKGTVVTLFDGSDTIIFASMDDAIL